ncbi:hypothetical protein ZOSMA_2G02660 [Zostera marina]|uniref:SOSEKI DIX-like domain-containing protein n=1 Tax=Zostera marina TaxID=29655 RepID=A0A0K9PDG9_ZOSMR|nr:hypothetical protein ZOSMA_2G02660 [Zostera marina]
MMSRDTTPDRARVYMAPKMKKLKKLQVIYYLSRNGQLEHPHFMEMSHLSNQPLRLKDVMDRMSALRGRAMSSLYSWSCKRTYKNGYVWNDLGENDVVYPAEGVEYILKGSEIVESCSEHFQQLQLTTARARPTVPKPAPPPSAKNQNHHRFHPEAEEVEEDDDDDDEMGLEMEEEEEEVEEADIVVDTAQSRCSRGVSTDHQEEQQQSELNCVGEVIGASSNSSSSSENTSGNLTTIPKNNNNSNSKSNSNNISCKSSSISVNEMTRTPSVLLQLIACGALPAKMKTGLKSPLSSSSLGNNSSGSSSIGSSGRKSLYKGVLSRLATNHATMEGDDYDVIKYMSENPRFGNLQMEDKEYFSGSIVETMQKTVNTLKRSSSYNEERSGRREIGDEEEEKKIKEKSLKGRCIPGRKKTAAAASSKSQQ